MTKIQIVRPHQEHDIGGKVRALRKARNLTLEELAKKLEVTASYLSRLERNHNLPSLPLLERLAGVFDVDIGTFFERTIAEAKPKRVLHPDEQMEIIAYQGRLVIKYFAHILYPRPSLEVMENLLKKGGRVVFPTRAGECCMIVIEGEINVEVGQERYTLDEGDSIYYTTDQFRRITNSGRKDARYISILYPPAYIK
ncbi:MAG TPA: XRE family transcriptional regulator [Proteobacteria bacterium]|nr:XRE family transcriptional regulator [Pseudomonadota bacterium]